MGDGRSSKSDVSDALKPGDLCILVDPPDLWSSPIAPLTIGVTSSADSGLVAFINFGKILDVVKETPKDYDKLIDCVVILAEEDYKKPLLYLRDFNFEEELAIYADVKQPIPEEQVADCLLLYEDSILMGFKSHLKIYER